GARRGTGRALPDPARLRGMQDVRQTIPHVRGLPMDNVPIGRRCKAKSQRSGEQCKKLAMKGKEVCAKHGGKSLSGIASPRFNHGMYSKYTPTDMGKRYELFLKDPRLLSLEDDVALLSVRFNELLEQMGKTATVPYESALNTLSSLQVAIKGGNPTVIQ